MSGEGPPGAMEGLDEAAAEAPTFPFFECCVCLDLLYKPIVLGCGHISCFWCVQKAMHGFRASHCPICRQPYSHFPGICQLLHFLLLKIHPVAYKRRGKEVLEEETHHACFSPQLLDHTSSERVHLGQNNSKEAEVYENPKTNGCILSEESGVAVNALCNQVSVDDALCAACKELLFQPVALNCGHVYCKSCLSGLASLPLKCQVCQSVHPGEFPNVCLDVDHFLEQQFPREYAIRKERVQHKIANQQHENPSSSALLTEKQNGESSSYAKENEVHSWLDEKLSNAHVGVGCDSCGMYPIIGKRYRCTDCEEKVGFDLCEECYNTRSKLPGRFNQQHTPDHRFELDDSQMLCKILMIRHMEEFHPGVHPLIEYEEHDNHQESDANENED